MPEQIDDIFVRISPSAERPLGGQMVLIVEDSRFASEAVRLMSIRSGARVRRADTLSSARRHLATYRPSITIVDLGLPDGSGTELIAELARDPAKSGAVVAISGDPETEAEATTAGAAAFLLKPLGNLGDFQESLLSLLPKDELPPDIQTAAGHPIELDRLALQDDLATIHRVMTADDATSHLPYIAQFLGSIARMAGDSVLEDAARQLRDTRGAAEAGALKRVADLVSSLIDRRAVV